MSESENMGKKLYEACVSGSVPALESLIEKDELILNRVNSLTCFLTPMIIVRRSIDGGPDLNPDDNCPPPQPQGWCMVLGEIMKWISWFWKTYFDIDPGWLKQVLGHLITAATLTATMAYQALLSPPGGVWQDSSKPDDELEHEAGDAILNTYGGSSQVAKYVVINTVVLVASLSTIILALSGFSLQNKFLLWVLIFTMYTTISFLAIAYFMVLGFIFPSLYSDYLSLSIIFKQKGNWIWLGVKLLELCYKFVPSMFSSNPTSANKPL